MVGNIVMTDDFFVPNPTKGITTAKGGRPESVMRLGPTSEILRQNCPEATQGSLWEQAADSKFRLMLAVASLGKVHPPPTPPHPPPPPPAQKDLRSWRV